MKLAGHDQTHAAICLTLMGLLSLFAGCTTIGTSGADVMELAGERQDVLPQTPQPNMAAISMEVRPAGKKHEIKQMPLGQGMRIQQALERAGLDRRFRRMDIHLMRTAGGERHKLDVKYSREEGFVNPLYDYALHPGDHLVVIEDPSTILDDMLQSLTGPAGRALGR